MRLSWVRSVEINCNFVPIQGQGPPEIYQQVCAAHDKNGRHTTVLFRTLGSIGWNRTFTFFPLQSLKVKQNGRGKVTGRRGPHRLLRAGSRAARGQTTIGICNCLNNRAILIVYIYTYIYTYIYIYIYTYTYIYIHTQPDGWLEVSNRKVLRPAISTQVLLGFPGS
jgi:hypothetical protein